MSSLPFISHHLFVAAAGQEGQARRKPVRREPPAPGPNDDLEAVPLALLESGNPRRVPRADPLRLAVVWGET